jgi:hypothetical protein
MLAAGSEKHNSDGQRPGTDFETKTTVDRREGTRIKGDDYWRVRVPV